MRLEDAVFIDEIDQRHTVRADRMSLGVEHGGAVIDQEADRARLVGADRRQVEVAGEAGTRIVHCDDVVRAFLEGKRTVVIDRDDQAVARSGDGIAVRIRRLDDRPERNRQILIGRIFGVVTGFAVQARVIELVEQREGIFARLGIEHEGEDRSIAGHRRQRVAFDSIGYGNAVGRQVLA